MKVGFTGTRSGMSDHQMFAVREHLLNLKPESVYHGGCLGADADFHDLCLVVEVPTSQDEIHILPGVSAKAPEDRSMQAVFGCGTRHPEKTHFARNRDIVNACDMLIATPYNDKRTGGTWYTIGYAEKQGKAVIIVPRELI